MLQASGVALYFLQLHVLPHFPFCEICRSMQKRFVVEKREGCVCVCGQFPFERVSALPQKRCVELVLPKISSAPFSSVSDGCA